MIELRTERAEDAERRFAHAVAAPEVPPEHF
jgi:hypothetical protein